MRIAYVCSRYPAVSHSFIQREVTALRELGVEIDTFSVRRARAHDVMSALDRDEFARTYAILPPNPRDFARAHLFALFRHPAAYTATLTRALGFPARGMRARLWQLFYFAEAVVLWDQCRRRGVRHVHAHFANVGSNVALLATRLGNVAAGGGAWSWSFTMHGSTEFYDVPGHALPEKVSDASLVACVSDYTRSQLMMWADERHWEKLVLARCAVDVDRFAPIPRRAPRDALRVLTVARLVRGKGLPLLLEAVAELRGEGHDVELVIVGDGPERRRIAKRSAELGVAAHVRLAGAVGQDQLRGYLRDADSFCLPSFAEGVPVVLMEAMAMALPVVATHITGIPELVEDGVSGLLVRPARVDDLAVALRRLATSDDLRRALGAAARRRICADYSLERSAATMAAEFAALDAAATTPRTPRRGSARPTSARGSRR